MHEKRAPIQQVASRVDEQGRRGDLRGRTGNRVAVEAEESGMAQYQPWWSQRSRQQLFEPQCCGVAAAGELGHEADARFLNPPRQTLELAQISGQRQGAVNAFAGSTRQVCRMQAEPLR